MDLVCLVDDDMIESIGDHGSRKRRGTSLTSSPDPPQPRHEEHRQQVQQQRGQQQQHSCRKYRCPFCPASFRNRRFMMPHMAEHLSCSASSAMANTSAMTKNNPEELPLYRCQVCDDAFFTHDQLVFHKFRSHFSSSTSTSSTNNHHQQDQIRCGICSETFASRSQFRLHLFDVHPRLGPKQCPNRPACPRGFWTRTALSEHATECTARGGELDKAEQEPPTGQEAANGAHINKKPSISIISEAKTREKNLVKATESSRMSDNEDDDNGGDFYSDHRRDCLAAQCLANDGSIVAERHRPRVKSIVLDRSGAEIESRLPFHAHLARGLKCILPDNFECEECGSSFESAADLLQHLDVHDIWESDTAIPPGPQGSSTRSSANLGGGSGDIAGGCVLCDFRPVPKSADVADRDAASQLQDHVISEHFEANLPKESVPPDTPSPEQARRSEDHCYSNVAADAECAVFRCGICFRTFGSRSHLEVHLRYQHNAESECHKELAKLMRCRRCSKDCKDLPQLILHRDLFCDVRLPCDRCELVFRHVAALATHVKTVHVQDQVQQQQHQPSPAGAAMVTEKVHHTCGKCGQLFADEEVLRTHTCSSKVVILNSNDDWRQKRGGHHTDRVEPTDESQQKNRPEHEVAAMTTYSCPMCKEGLTSSAAVLSHLIRQHRKEAAENEAECDICDYSSSSITVFYEHYKKHLMM